MRIVQVSPYRLEEEAGSLKAAHELAKRLSQKHQVLFVCFGDKSELEKANKNLTYLKTPSLKVSHLTTPSFPGFYAVKIRKTLSEFKPDIVHIHNTSFNCKIALKWANENNIPCVITFHFVPTKGFSHVSQPLYDTMFGKAVQEMINQTEIKSTLEKVDQVVALNTDVLTSVRELNKTVPVTLINWGIDLKKFQKAKIKKQNSNYNFIFVGSYTLENLPPNFQLTLYGNKSTGVMYVTKLLALIKLKQIQNVKIQDSITHDQLVKKLEESDYFLSASVQEVQSLVIIEALASGTPVIGLENETVSGMVTSSNGLVLKKDITPEDFAAKLKTFVESNRESYEKMCLTARKDSAGFDINDSVSKIEKLYKTLI